MSVNPGQQFCLRWNNHQSTLISVLDTLLENETFVDCTLAAEGQCLRAHKVVLSACSPYLETLLNQHYEKHPVLILKDVTFMELKAMLDYMYRGEVNICQDQLGQFLKAAESLQIKGLTDNSSNDPVRSSLPLQLPPKLENLSTTNSATSPGSGYTSRKLNNSLLANVTPPTSKTPSFPQGLVVESRPAGQKLVVNNNNNNEPITRLEGNSSPKRRKRRRSFDDSPTSASVTGNSSNISQDDSNVFSRVQSQSLVTDSSDKSNSNNNNNNNNANNINNNNNNNNEMADTLKMKTEECLTPKDMSGGSVKADNNESGGEEMLDADDEEELDLSNPTKPGTSHLSGSTNNSHPLGIWNTDSQGEESYSPGGHQEQDSKKFVRSSMGHMVSWDLWASVQPELLKGMLNQSKYDYGGSGEGVECSQCGRHYKLKSSLRNHQKWECGKEPQFQCPYCQYRAKQKMHVARHIERMHREKLDMLEAAERAAGVTVDGTSLDSRGAGQVVTPP